MQELTPIDPARLKGIVVTHNGDIGEHVHDEDLFDYNYLVDTDGSVLIGTGDDQCAAASNYLTIALVGNTALNYPTEAAVEGCRDLIGKLLEDWGPLDVVPHSAVANTWGPGSYVPMGYLKSDDPEDELTMGVQKGNRVDFMTRRPNAARMGLFDSPIVVGSNGQAVADWQIALGVLQTEYFNESAARLTACWQEHVGLEATGVVDAVTWSEMFGQEVPEAPAPAPEPEPEPEPDIPEDDIEEEETEPAAGVEQA